MLFLFSKLKNLPVFTRSGIKLGQIADIEIDLDSQSIIRYVVRRGMVSRQTLMIHRSQVICITGEKMVVEDSVAKVDESIKIKEAVAQPATSVSARQ